MTLVDPTRLGFTLLTFLLFGSIFCEDQCKKGCSTDSGPLKPILGLTYRYNYEGKIDILLSTAAGQRTSTELRALVLVTQQSNCDQILRLQNVQIVGPDGKKRTGIPHIERPVILNNNNGVLDDSLCSEEVDTEDSLNLKRAIASFFQVNLQKTSEIDVFGQCPTQIMKEELGNEIVITKTKNLNECLFRESISHNLFGAIFISNSHLKSSPLLRSGLVSKQQIKGGILTSASVIENYLFLPFSVGQNGAKAVVESKLTLIGTSEDNFATECMIRKSIIFKSYHPNNIPRSNSAVILKQLREISEKLATSVDDLTALHFIDLVKLIRMSTKSDLLTVYNQVKSETNIPDKQGTRKLFLDAILFAGNGETIEVAIELLKSKELNELEERQLYLGLSNAKHVTENTIQTAMYLLNKENFPPKYYLGIGSLAGIYCKHHKCEGSDIINEIIDKFFSTLGDLKASDRKEENKMIYVLKGLTNIGFLNGLGISKLTALATDKNEPSRLRVAALEAYQINSCEDKIRKSALGILSNIHEDSEIRIKAYLILTHCPDAKTGNAIKLLLDKEESQQVGGFISSHIKNLRSSINPDKLLAKTHLGFIHTPNRFPFDPRKYSFNGEFSSSVDRIGLSKSVEGNVIFSQNSWLPRSTNLNLTAEIFGQRFNFLEVTTRQENWEDVIEHYLGPQGIFRKATLQETWDGVAKPIKNVYETLKEKINNSLRARRHTSQASTNSSHGGIEMKTHYFNKNFDLDLSVRTFGTEIFFMNSFDTTNGISSQSIIDNLVSNFDIKLNQLKNFEETFRSNLLFLDAEVSYPTSLGFPLRLSLDGASNFQVKTSGKIDVPRLISRDAADDIQLKLSIHPSATITITGKFSLDTPLLDNGLKVSSTLYTSTGAELSAETFKNNLGLDVKLNFPPQRQKIIHFSHDIIFQTKENEIVLESRALKFSQNINRGVCLDLMDYIGSRFCLDSSEPDSSGKKIPIIPFPLSGDFQAGIRIDRSDIDSFHYRREILIDGKRLDGFTACLETLAKNVTKGVALNVKCSMAKENYVEFSLISPMKSAQARAEIILKNNEKLLNLSLKDGSNIYTAKAGLLITESKNKKTYKPIIEYTIPGHEVPQVPQHHIEGQIISEKEDNNFKIIFDNIKIVLHEKRGITLTGNIGTKESKYFSNLKLTDGNIFGSALGSLEIQKNLVKFHAQAKNNVKPVLNFDVDGEVGKQNERIHSKLFLSMGKDFESKSNAIILFHNLNLTYERKLEFSTRNTFSNPSTKTHGEFDIEKSLKFFKYDAHLHCGEVNLGSEMKAEVHCENQGDFDFFFKVFGGKSGVAIKSIKKVIGSYESHSENSFVINGKRLDIGGKIQHNMNPNNLELGADLTIHFPNNQKPLKLNNKLKINSQELEFLLKTISGSQSIIDILLKNNINQNINGHIKVNYKEIFLVLGNIKSQKGTGNVNLMIGAKSFNRKINAEAAFVIRNPTYNLALTVYPDDTRELNKKIMIDTKNKWTGSHFDSSNIFNLLGSTLSLNIQGQTGNVFHGNTSWDVDLTLPSKQFLMGKLRHDVFFKDGAWNSDNLIHLEHRDQESSLGDKLIFKTVVKDTNLAEGIANIIYTITIDDSITSKINVDGNFKRYKNGENWNTQFKEKVSGSAFKNPIIIRFNGESGFLARNFDLKSEYGQQLSLQIRGKYDVVSEKNPAVGQIDVELKSVFQLLSYLKMSHALSITNSEAQNQSMEFSGLLQSISTNPSFNIDINSAFKALNSENEKSIQFHGEMNKPIKLLFDVSGKYNVDTERNVGLINGSIKMKLPENRQIDGSVYFSRMEPHAYNIEVSLDIPVPRYKYNKFSVHTKRTDRNQINSQIQLISNEKKYSLNSNLCLTTEQPSFKIEIVNADGKITEMSAGVERPSNARLLGKLKVLCQQKNFILEGGLDINSENLNDLYVQLIANCPRLNIEDVVVKVGNFEAHDSNSVDILVTTAGKKILSGRALASTREEHGKFILEGSGKFKIGDEEKSGIFKYIRTTLNFNEHGETGDEVSFDATFGNKAIDAEFKLTDKEFRYLNSFCEESKRCAHVEINTRTNSNDFTKYDNKIEITVDLKVLGIPNEFGLQVVTHRENWLLNHTLDIHLENNVNKYQSSLYIHPNDFSISLTTPQRTIALEADINLPKYYINVGGKAAGKIAFYTDKKNNPDIRTSLGYIVNIDLEKRVLDAEVILNIAEQSKPFSIKYHQAVSDRGFTTSANRELTIDIFTKSDQRLVLHQAAEGQFSGDSYLAHAESSMIIKSVGLGIDIGIKQVAAINPKNFSANWESTGSFEINNRQYNTKSTFAVTPKGATVHIELPKLFELIAEVDFKIRKEIFSIKCSTDFLECNVDKNLTTGNNSLKHENYPKCNSSTNVSTSKINQTELGSMIQNKNTKTELFHATIKLDETTFLQPDVVIRLDNIRQFLQKLTNKTDIQILSQDLKYILDKANENIPSLVKTQRYYESEIEKFRNELAKDEILVDIKDFIEIICTSIASILSDFMESANTIIGKIGVVLSTAFSDFLKTIQSDLMPKLKEIIVELYCSIKIVAEEVVNVVYILLGKCAEIFVFIKPNLIALVNTLSDICEGFRHFIVETYKVFKTSIIEQMKHLREELTSSPFVSELQNRYKQFMKNGLPFKEAIINTMKALNEAIKEVIFVPEIQDLVDAIEQYLEKKVLNKPVDDAVELHKIIILLTKDFDGIPEIFSEDILPYLLRNIKFSALDISVLKILPSIMSRVRVSTLEYLLKESNEPFVTFLVNLVRFPYESLIPPALYADVGPSEILTFDGKIYHFSSSCSYLLATDVVDKNFTLIYTLKNKQIDSVTLSDKFGIITLKGGKIFLDNVETEYPAIKDGLRAYLYLDRIEIHSDVGVFIRCEKNLLGCGFEVSGFYHGQMRGILGNGNNEPFDDLLRPNGEIASGIKDLVQDYSIGQCSNQPSPIEVLETTTSPLCERTFGWESPLRYCFPFVPTNRIKKACEVNAASGGKDTERLYSIYYAYACWSIGIPVVVPDYVNSSCKNSVNEHQLHDNFEVKLPGKAADVVIVLSTNKENEVIYNEYLKPMVEQIAKKFNTEGVSDVLFYFVIFGGQNREYSLVTIKRNLAFGNSAPDLKFSDHPKPLKLVTGHTEIDKVFSSITQFLNDAKIFLGIGQSEKAFLEGINYPYRAEAVKTLIVATDISCEMSGPIPFINSMFRVSKELHLTLISPEKKITIKQNEASTDIIGFNSTSVIFLSGANKRTTTKSDYLIEQSRNNPCFQATLDNEGDIYPSNLLLAHKNSKQEIIEIIASNIVNKALRKEMELECSCSYLSRYPFEPFNICRIAKIKYKR